MQEHAPIFEDVHSKNYDEMRSRLAVRVGEASTSSQLPQHQERYMRILDANPELLAGAVHQARQIDAERSENAA